jgi:hypothetical protein
MTTDKSTCSDRDSGTVPALVGLSDCLEEINNALNYWYPLRSDDNDTAYEARHVRLFEFRNRLKRQIAANNSITGG